MDFQRASAYVSGSEQLLETSAVSKPNFHPPSDDWLPGHERLKELPSNFANLVLQDWSLSLEPCKQPSFSAGWPSSD